MKSSASMPPKPYIIGKRLAAGGMAELFAAHAEDRYFDRPIVIKRILPELARQRSFVKMFINEARLSTQLRHPNIVKVYDFEANDDGLSLIMEFVDGPDLRAVMRRLARRRSPMPKELAVYIICHVLEALDYAHNAESMGAPLAVVHRDVSPSNILLTRRGLVKLADFGIARTAQQQQETATGTLKGKYAYMSPEQVRGDRIDRRTDLFSAAIVLTEMLTGHRLFSARTELDLLLMVRSADLRQYEKHSGDIDEDLDRIIRKALSPEVSRRYRSAAEFRDELVDWMSRSSRRASAAHLIDYLASLERECGSWADNGKANREENDPGKPLGAGSEVRATSSAGTPVVEGLASIGSGSMTAENDPLCLRVRGGESPDYVTVDQSPFSVGRRAGNDLQIAHDSVSGRHAELFLDQSSWWVSDLGSTNGTFVNGERVSGRIQLQPGDILQFATRGYAVVPSSSRAEHRSDGATQVLANVADVEGTVELFELIDDQRTFALFQPIIALDTGTVVGWEALGRGLGNKDCVSPARLFELAEGHAVAAQLSQRFRESTLHCTSCGHCWPQERTALFFNLHPEEARADLYSRLIETLSLPALQRRYQVVLEIHESIVADTETLRRLVNQARNANIRIAYDDFGAGQSRLSDLSHVPPDYLKLDRSLISDIHKPEQHIKRSLVEAIVKACRQLSVITLAEGIESSDEFDACVEMGISLGQGYLFCRPHAPFKIFGSELAELPSDCPFVDLEIAQKFV